MFPRRNRLSREELSKVLKNGRVVHGSFFTIRVYNPGDNLLKTAFIISKKELKHSVDRNLAKRRSRMAIREIVGTIPHQSMAIMLKKQAATMNFKEMVEEFRGKLA
jgi:ribonuclease P protein component